MPLVMRHVELQSPLDRRQSERLLQFCLDSGVDCFSVTFVHWDDRQVRQVEANVFDRLAPFRLRERLLERTVLPAGSDRFISMQCWSFNPQTIPLILAACGGSLTSYEMGRLPEDWTFYRGDLLFLGIVSHERYAYLLLPDEDFQRLELLGWSFTVRAS